MVQVSVLYFPGCPNWPEAGRRLRHALDQIDHAATAVTFVPVDTDIEETAVNFPGSPTFTVDGEDLFPTGQPASGLSCRVYPTASGPAGVPDLADLIAALRERARR